MSNQPINTKSLIIMAQEAIERAQVLLEKCPPPNITSVALELNEAFGLLETAKEIRR